uniref:Uncharacterized protein n=1 Tax=Phlebotomus papatasi TaxID=29031 RepID=A0A1B0DPY3_PHLPP
MEELGDYDAECHVGEYVSSIRFSLRQTDTLERKVMELHQKREPGQEIRLVQDEFMQLARGLETYGVDPHPVKDHRGTQLYLGINFSGISTFAVGRRAQHFRWPEIHKLNYEGKMFIAHLSYIDSNREQKKHTIGFKCPTGAACRYVWRCAIEQMLFFTLPNSQHASVVSGGGFFSWGTKFRYSGRTEREILSEALRQQQQLANNSSPSKRKANSVPATPSSPQGDLAEIRYSSLPRSTMSEPLGGCSDHLSSAYCTDTTLPLLETVSEESRKHSNMDVNSDLLSDYYYRDSFDHSSSESGLTLTESRLGIQRQFSTSDQSAPVAAATLPHATNHAVTSAHLIQQQNATNTAKSAKKFSLIQAFVPSFIFVVLVLVLSTIFIIESDSEMFVQLKNWPEMVCLRYEYYQPLKDFLIKKIGSVF